MVYQHRLVNLTQTYVTRVRGAMIHLFASQNPAAGSVQEWSPVVGGEGRSGTAWLRRIELFSCDALLRQLLVFRILHPYIHCLFAFLYLSLYGLNFTVVLACLANGSKFKRKTMPREPSPFHPKLLSMFMKKGGWVKWV